jgi:hypothetical protein
MIGLRSLLNEILEPLEVDEAAMDDAKRQGLEYLGFGRYGKDGHVTHKSANGKLVPVAIKTGTTTPSKKPRTASQLVPVAIKTGTTTPSKKPRTASQKAADAYARSKGDLNRQLRADDKLRNAERAKDPDYDEKADERPHPAYDASITIAKGGGGSDGQASDTIGYDYSDPYLGGGRSISRGRAKPDMRPREEFKKFTSKKTGKTYAWKWDTPDDVAPTLPGRSSDGGEWLDSMGKGVYGKNGVATHREDAGKLTPLNKK